jgi:hypothetical protein
MSKFIIGPIVAIVVFGIFGSIAYLAYRNWQQRIADFQALGAKLRLQYFPKGDPSLFPLLSNLDFFHRGGAVRVDNLLMGRVTRQQQPATVAIFDYQYSLSRTRERASIGDGISFSSETESDSFSHTMLVFYDPALDLPRFTLRAENLFDKIAKVMGEDDINFPDAPQFSKRYSLQGEFESEVRSLFQPNLIEFCQQANLCLEANGSYLVAFPIYAGHHRETKLINGVNASQSCILDVDEIEPTLDRCLRLLAILDRNQSATAIPTH